MKIVFSIKIYISIPKFNEIRRQVQKLELFQCLKRSVSVNVLANSQALYITNGNVTRILGPGQTRSSLIADKQTEIQLQNNQNPYQHSILHKYTKN